MEQNAGIKNQLSNDVTFRMLFLLHENYIVGLFILGFWSLCFFGILGWIRVKVQGIQGIKWGLLAMSGVSFLILGAALLNRAHFRHFAVLNGEGKSVPLFQDKKRGEGKLVDLPSGIIVNIGRIHQGMAEIVDPVVGWVSQENLLSLQTNLTPLKRLDIHQVM